MLTTLLNCASATRFSASALTSSCSSTTNLVLSGSRNFTLWISSIVLALPSLDGCTLLSVFRIALIRARAASSPCAYASSWSPNSPRIRPNLSVMSATASSPVCSPHSLSWTPTEARSCAAVSWAPTRVDCDFIMRMRRRARSELGVPRRERKEKALRTGPAGGAAGLLLLLERMESALCLEDVSPGGRRRRCQDRGNGIRRRSSARSSIPSRPRYGIEHLHGGV